MFSRSLFQSQRRLAHAVAHHAPKPNQVDVNMTLETASKRWTELVPEQKEFIKNKLHDIMKQDWKTLSMEQKRAGEFFFFFFFLIIIFLYLFLKNFIIGLN